MRAAAALLAAARARGAEVRFGTELVGIERGAGRRGPRRGAPDGHRRDAGDRQRGRRLGARGRPARGHRAADRAAAGAILVTEPLAPLIRHKVYAADYVAAVSSADEGLLVSPVIEGTPERHDPDRSSRERVGFDGVVPVAVLRALAAAAVALFPALAGVRAMRAYHGFRPYCPDHLPVIGEDPEVPGLWHAGGHEGAGIGLAPGTAQLVVAGLTATPPPLDPRPFDPGRFAAVAA